MGWDGVGEWPPAGFVVCWEPAPCGRGWVGEWMGAVSGGWESTLPTLDVSEQFLFYLSLGLGSPGAGESWSWAGFSCWEVPPWEPWRHPGIRTLYEKVCQQKRVDNYCKQVFCICWEWNAVTVSNLLFLIKLQGDKTLRSAFSPDLSTSNHWQNELLDSEHSCELKDEMLRGHFLF